MGRGASMGNSPSPLDIRSHASFLLGFVSWKWQILSSISRLTKNVQYISNKYVLVVFSSVAEIMFHVINSTWKRDVDNEIVWES